MRIGTGYDVHRVVSGRDLIIGGVNIPFEKGLLGHSDADVLVHAIMDALLGALALGDIGKYFPDDDDSFRGMNSMLLLEKVRKMICERGFGIVNIDSVIIAQKPKLSGYIDDMRKNIARVLKIGHYQIGVKATTEEYMGFTGNCTGIKAHAVCLLKKEVNDA